MTANFPSEGVELTVLLVVSDLAWSRAFYTDVLGATVFREYGDTSCVLQFQGTWLLLVTGAEPVRRSGVSSGIPMAIFLRSARSDHDR